VKSWQQILLFSLPNAAIAFTVAETKIFAPFRNWTKQKSAFFGELVSCGYCLGHWTAFAIVAIYRPRLFDLWSPLDFFLTAVTLAWLSAFQWILLCWLMHKAGK
jgi:hypothetical protein